MPESQRKQNRAALLAFWGSLPKMKRKTRQTPWFSLPSDVQALFAAIQAGDLNDVTCLLNKGISANVGDPTALQPSGMHSKRL